MASLKCSHCGFGIHYGGMPNGIEYTAISQDLWNKYSNTDKLIICYVTEGNGDFLTVWKCPQCGCIHIMDGFQAFVKQAFGSCDEPMEIESARKYVVLIDYLLEETADRNWTAAQFMQSGEYPNDQFFYAMVGDAGVIVYEDADCSTPLRRYKAIETVMED